MTDPHVTLDPVPPPEAHLGWLQPTRALAERVVQHVGEPLRRLAQGRGHGLRLAVGQRGSQVAPLLIEADAEGVRASLSERSWVALLEGGMVALPDPVAPEEPVSTTALVGVGGESMEGLAPGDALLVAMAVQTACLDHLASVLADAPSARCAERVVGVGGRTSKAWLYDVLANLPGLVGVDHSAALLMPAQLHGDAHPQYVVAAERMFVRAGHRLPAPLQDHLVGLLIPCWGGCGGLLEEALAQQRRDPACTFHLFAPATEGGDAMERWRLLGGAVEGDDALVARFRVDAARAHEELLVLIPLAVPGELPAFLSLNYTQPTALPASTAAIFERLSERFADALTRSELFRLPVERLEVLGAFGEAASAGAVDRARFVHHLTPQLHQRLGAASVSIGLVQAGAEEEGGRLVFENPQGWDLDQPLVIPHLRADSLAALAMRMRRSLLLAGGHAIIPGAPAIRWNNSLMVNERLNRVVDRRMAPALGLTLSAESGWRALAEYYKPTTSLAVYVAVAVPLVLDGEVIGVLALDFERATPWGAYSGFAAERLHQMLARLITSHLALLPPYLEIVGCLGYDGRVAPGALRPMLRACMSVDRDQMFRWIDELLQVRLFSDYSPIGLQVEGRAQVERVALGVSANLALIQAATAWGADALLVHHGFFWKGEPLTLRGWRKERIKALLVADLSLGSYHLPLDAHAEIGNNACIADRLELPVEGRTPFARAGGQPIGLLCRHDPIPIEALLHRLRNTFGSGGTSFLSGPALVSCSAIVTGSGASYFEEARGLGAELFITGEAREPTMAEAAETRAHFVAPGHYNTETLGIQALGRRLEERFGVEVRYFDLPNPV